MNKEEIDKLKEKFKPGTVVIYHKNLTTTYYDEDKFIEKDELQDSKEYVISRVMDYKTSPNIFIKLEGKGWEHPIDVFTIKEEEFILPDKWCVKHYKEVAKYIIKLIGHNYGNYVQDLELYSHFPPHPIEGYDGYCYSYILKDYKEITIEQFKKYVLKENNNTPERISFYVKYSKDFTEDLYNKLMSWCKDNSKGLPRGYADYYNGLIEKKHFLFDNWGLHSNKYDDKEIINKYTYGVDNNTQGCKNKYTIEDVRKLIKYEEEYKYTPEYCKNPNNKVAIHVVTPEEVIECDELLNNNKAHAYLYNNLCYNDNTQCINPYNKEHSNIDWFKSNNYEIIEAKDFINKNKKEMKKKTFKVGDVVLINTVSKGSVNTVGKGVVQAIDDKGWAYVTSGFNHKVDKTPRWEEFDNLTLSSLEEGDWMVIDNLDNKFNGKIGHVGRVVDTNYGIGALYKLEPYCIGKSWAKSNLRFASVDEIPKEYTFRFADTFITVTKGKIELSGVGKGIVAIEELEAVINYFLTSPTIAGYGVAIYDWERGEVISMYNNGYKVAFGCQYDELSILEEVKDAYYKLNK